MRALRLFVPNSMAALEGRLVMSVSGGAAAAATAAEVGSARLTEAQIAQSNATDAAFALNTTDSVHNDIAVAEHLTTTYNDGSTQTETIVTAPDALNNTTTTYKTIELRNNGGIERIVDVENFTGGLQPFSGNDNTHDVTITLPNGQTETNTYREVITGNRTVANGIIQRADGSLATWTSEKITNGPTTTTTKTITEPDGSVKVVKTITTLRGELDTTTSTTTHTSQDPTPVRTYSATDVLRVPLPTN